MKKILTIAVALLSTTSFANTTTSGAVSQQGQTAVVSNDSHNAASDLSNMVPTATAPNLATTLTETCMGSTSAGASGAGFGFSFGTTWRDSACVRRLDSRQMSAFGDISTAREMMCDSELVREAAKRAGRPCVEDGGVPYGQAIVAPVPHQVQEVATPEAAAPVVKQIVRQ